jgi:hypothetical protein
MNGKVRIKPAVTRPLTRERGAAIQPPEDCGINLRDSTFRSAPHHGQYNVGRAAVVNEKAEAVILKTADQCVRTFCGGGVSITRPVELSGHGFATNAMG